MDRPGNSRGGFTVIELLIMVAIIAVLAEIVIPRVLGAGQKTKEAVLRGQLEHLRKAIAQFRSDCGDYPALLEQLQTQPAEGQVGGTGGPLDVADWSGPYLSTPDGGLPEDPFIDATDSWGYEPATGEVWSGSDLISLDGDPYANW